VLIVTSYLYGFVFGDEEIKLSPPMFMAKESLEACEASGKGACIWPKRDWL
jgi:hypothetical protein